jgi:DAK2 domain fusion protein YloV
MVTTEEGLERAPREWLYARYRTINGHNLRHSVSAALAWLEVHYEVVNQLNVFPVPDGDTGTNMLLTMQAAWREIEANDDPSISAVAQAIAQGALMGARGNSGVILSQIWRGFARALDGLDEVSAEALAEALDEARETAYRGVVRPVEGTILTVSKDIATAAENALSNGSSAPLALLEAVVAAASESVKRTPELLPVLREAKVVDAGGKGLFYILEGMLRGAYRLPLDERLQDIVPLDQVVREEVKKSVEPGQDWEVVVDFRPNAPLDIVPFYGWLESRGTSIQVGEGEGIYRMHIHVPDGTQYEPIEYIRGFGTVTKVHIENLMDQTGRRSVKPSEIEVQPIAAGEIASVAVVPGTGIAEVFASLGVSAIVEGGQTMNPSTEDILSSFENLPTDDVIILPNNKNILGAAKQAGEMTVKNVRILPTISVPQGIAAMIVYDKTGDLDQVTTDMSEAFADLSYGEITRATRSVQIEGVRVQEGQVIGLLNGKLTVSGDDLEGSIIELIEHTDHESAELLTLYYGQSMTQEQAEAISASVSEAYAHLQVELYPGDQPHYQFILSLE